MDKDTYPSSLHLAISQEFFLVALQLIVRSHPHNIRRYRLKELFVGSAILFAGFLQPNWLHGGRGTTVCETYNHCFHLSICDGLICLRKALLFKHETNVWIASTEFTKQFIGCFGVSGRINVFACLLCCFWIKYVALFFKG